MAHVTFIHGIGNKPEASALLGIWRRRLAQGSGGLALGDLNVESTMIYWADVLYESPDPNVGAFERAEGRDLIEAAAEPAEPAAPPAPTIEESTFIAGLAAKVGGTLAAAESVAAITPDRDAESGEFGYERVPLPWALKRRFLEHFLRDVASLPLQRRIPPAAGRPVQGTGRDPAALRRPARGRCGQWPPAYRGQPLHGHGDRLRLSEAGF